MTVATTIKLVLEPAAQKFADATANPPFLFDLGPEKGRETVDEVQSGDDRQARRRHQRHHRARRPDRRGVGPHPASPQARPARCPVIVYIHGAGWVFGNAHTHDRLDPRARRRRERRRRVPQLQPLARGEVPHRDRGVLRRRRAGSPQHGAEHGPRPDAHRRRRRLRRRQHDRRRSR